MENETNTQENTQRELSYGKEDVIKLPPTIQAVIIDMKLTKAKTIFVDKQGNIKTDKPEDDFLTITVENKQYDIVKEYHMRDYVRPPENSHLGKLINRVGDVKVGVEVPLLKNSDNYYDLGI